MIDLTGYKLTFDEEFNRRSISQIGQGTTWADIRPDWRFDAHSDIGFGKSSFVDPSSGYDPFSVEGGALSITAVPDRTQYGYRGSWESGLISTQGSFSQAYGYFEIRADLADASGAWDAFWLLPDAPAPNPEKRSGWQELDIVEHYGTNNKGVYRWIHTTDPEPNQNPSRDLQVYSEHDSQLRGYHTYGMDWQPDLIRFYFDGEYVGSRPTPSDMHGKMYILANLAVTAMADPAAGPMTMKIDYIRAYSKAPDAVAVLLDTVSAPDGQDPGLYGASTAPIPTVSLEAPPVPSSVVSAISTTLPAGAKTLLLTGSAAIRGIGNDSDNVITGNVGANLLDGRGGADTMRGGEGNDVFIVDDVRDRAIEANDAGRDTVKASVSFALAGGADNLVLTGVDDLDGKGNSLANVITGNDGNNTLSGGLGNDRLIGGAGDDTFVFATRPSPANVDRIHDFTHGYDTIALDHAIFAKLAAGPLPSHAFKDITAPSAKLDASDRILYDRDTGSLFYDADGSGPIKAVRFAVLDDHPKVNHADFLIV